MTARCDFQDVRRPLQWPVDRNNVEFVHQRQRRMGIAPGWSQLFCIWACSKCAEDLPNPYGRVPTSPSQTAHECKNSCNKCSNSSLLTEKSYIRLVFFTKRLPRRSTTFRRWAVSAIQACNVFLTCSICLSLEKTFKWLSLLAYCLPKSVLVVLDRHQISSFEISDTASFPVEALAASTSLDRAQVEVLQAALMQKIAVIQGPPGTGNV